MKKLKLKENEVVHCATLEEAKKVLKIAHELGFTWCSGEVYLNNYLWDVYKENTCYNLKHGEYSFLQYNKDKCRSIITSKEFIKRHKKKNKYKVLEDKLNIVKQEKDKEIKAIDDLFCNALKRINVLEAIVNATNESVTIIKSDETTEETALRVFEEACKEVEENKYTLENIQVDCRGLNEDQIKEMCKVYESNGFKKWDKIKEYPYSEHMYFLSYDEECESKGYYYHAKQNRKHTITYDKFIELFGNKEPQIGDVVKAWDDDKSKFAYGVLVSIDKESLYPYEVGSIWTQNIEKVT